ncbi:hypothetical protein [Niabella terrae]
MKKKRKKLLLQKQLPALFLKKAGILHLLLPKQTTSISESKPIKNRENNFFGLECFLKEKSRPYLFNG